MILKMVEIHQVDYIDDISKGFVDGGDRSIQSLLRHSVCTQVLPNIHGKLIKGKK